MSFSSTNRKRYIALKESGVCVRCRVEKAREGRTECDQCSEERNESCMRRYVKNKSEDLCNAVPKKQTIARDENVRELSNPGSSSSA